MVHTFEVRDLRKKGYFMIDDAYLNGYAKIFGPTASMVYFSLCRHCDKEQKSFPPQMLIGQELNVNERTVRRMIKLLQDANLISVEKVRTKDGKWLNNSYFLLDKSHWKSKEELTTGHPCPMDKPEDISDTAGGHPCPMDKPEDISDTAGGHPCPIKDTHTKETHKDILHISSERQHGNDDVNEVLDYLQKALGLPGLDGSDKVNRQYAWLLIRKSKTGVDGVRWLIDQAASDPWWRNHITSVRDLWNNKIKIVSSKRSEVKVFNVEN